MNKKSRVLIVDDSTSTRKGMRALLSIQPEMEVVGEAPDGYTAMEIIAELQPDLVLLDVQMPGMTGIEVTREIKTHWPQIKVILMTMYNDYRSKAMEAGADAFLAKGTPPRSLVSVIREVAQT